MRILHISDLHFGAHRQLLATNLGKRVESLKPNLVICSGDVADDVMDPLNEDARSFLDGLGSSCLHSDKDPCLIVVPGNHDARKKGWLWTPFKRPYVKWFGQVATDHLFREHGVWVFGFDSSDEGSAGGSGKIKDEDLERFHRRCEDMADDAAFVRAFKIVVVHHHPLPVNWEHNRADKWLTMNNAGVFLSSVLSRQIDLVLHGHEHIQARARLWSTLGGNNHQAAVVSLGATLSRDVRDRNWFGLIDIDPSGVRVNFYGSISTTHFSDKPEGETFWVRSPLTTADAAFENRKEERGVFYRAVASVTMLDRDGDAARSIECEDLTFLRDPAGIPAVTVSIPHTSGYVDAVRLKGQRGPRLEKRLAPGESPHEFVSTIAFDQQPGIGEPTDFSVQWQSVNAYAMDRRQFDHLYKGDDAQLLDNIEFTHYVVDDSVEQLTVVARFPEGFIPINPRLRVARCEKGVPIRRWKTDAMLERALNEDNALRYYDSIHIAAMRVRRPQPGFSYGIQWELPDPPRREDDDYSIQIAQVLALLRGATPAQRSRVEGMLSLMVETCRQLLMSTRTRRKPWAGSVEASLMIFDEEQHTLGVTAAIVANRDKIEARDYSRVMLGYGEGIGGRCFKANQIRVFVDDRDSDRSKHYVRLEHTPAHKVLVSFPVQAPAETGQVWAPYGVLNFGSTELDCPLRLIQPDRSDWRSKLSAFKAEADLKLHGSLTEIFLDDPVES